MFKLTILSVFAAFLTFSPPLISPQLGDNQQIIINDPRLPVAVDQHSFCIAGHCYYNPNGLARNEVYAGVAFLIAAYVWLNRRDLAFWWKVQLDNKLGRNDPKKLNSPTRKAQKVSAQHLNKSDDLRSGMATNSTATNNKNAKNVWYVCVDGKHRGPYEKYQLRSFEKINANSLVRRSGEAWQRAGDIPELLDFLE